MKKLTLACLTGCLLFLLLGDVKGQRPVRIGETVRLGQPVFGQRLVRLPASLRADPGQLGRHAPKTGLAASPLTNAVASYHLPGEFEPQRALLLGCHELVDDMPELLAEIASHTWGRIELVLLVNDAVEYQKVVDVVRGGGVPLDRVHFAEVPHDTMWCRDYGPMVVRDRFGRAALVDSAYDEDRAMDDGVPAELALKLNLPVIETTLTLEGGNLLSNGDGICVTTSRVLDSNPELDEATIRQRMRHVFGARQTVILQPLDGESTGHVDMFATFVARDAVVVGAVDPNTDPTNAAILDDNARQLSRLNTQRGPLRVFRVPMPPHDDDVWRTYTNVVYANGVLLVPKYVEQDPRGFEQAAELYRYLLPGWQVVGVDAERVVQCGGAVHCVTLNMGPLERIPRFPTPSSVPEDAPLIFDQLLRPFAVAR